MEKDMSSSAVKDVSRRKFLAMMGAAGVTLAAYKIATKNASAAEAVEPVSVQDVKQGEDVFTYVTRVKGSFDQKLYQQVIGSANDFKEGGGHGKRPFAE